MSVHASTNRWAYDDETALAPLSAPQTLAASGASTDFISVDVLTSYWATGDVAQNLIIGVHVDVTAVAGTNPTAAFVVQVAPDTGAFGSPVSVGEVANAVGVGSFTIDVDRDDITNALGANPTAGSLRLYATLGGTSPSFTYVAYVSPVAGM
jgi:hypothetical protein